MRTNVGRFRTDGLALRVECDSGSTTTRGVVVLERFNSPVPFLIVLLVYTITPQ